MNKPTFMQNRYYMKDEVPFQDFPVYAETSKGSSKGVLILFVVIFLVAAILGGLYFLGRTQKSGVSAKAQPTETPAPTQVATSTPSATVSATLTPSPSISISLNRSKLAVAVLNGSGVRGAANNTAATLRNLGYTVGATGNAARFNYTGITILIKKAESAYSDLLKKDLNAPGAAVTIDDTITTDAVVIIGR